MHRFRTICKSGLGGRRRVAVGANGRVTAAGYRPRMSVYRRVRVPGGTVFVTVASMDRRATTPVDHVVARRVAVAATECGRPSRIDAMAVLPDLLHAIWT